MYMSESSYTTLFALLATSTAAQSWRTVRAPQTDQFGATLCLAYAVDSAVLTACARWREPGFPSMGFASNFADMPLP